MSGSVPASKVSSMRDAPAESLVADMYRRLSNPVILDSMTWVTLFSRSRPRRRGRRRRWLWTRGDGGILGYGQVVDGEQAGGHDDDGDDPGEDRSLKEEFRQHGRPPSVLPGGLRDRLAGSGRRHAFPVGRDRLPVRRALPSAGPQHDLLARGEPEVTATGCPRAVDGELPLLHLPVRPHEEGEGVAPGRAKRRAEVRGWPSC